MFASLDRPEVAGCERQLGAAVGRSSRLRRDSRVVGFQRRPFNTGAGNCPAGGLLWLAVYCSGCSTSPGTFAFHQLLKVLSGLHHGLPAGWPEDRVFPIPVARFRSGYALPMEGAF